MESKVEQIIAALAHKASTKQAIYRNTKVIFDRMKEIAAHLAEFLDVQFQKIDPNVKVRFKDVNEFEFHLKFSGDLLIYTMHSNIITLQPEHIVMKSPYVQEDEKRGYFGSIMVYNFIADSIKYNRLTDPGYLMARMFINDHGHFYVEGVRQLSFLYADIAKNEISNEVINHFIEAAMLLAISKDLYAPKYQDIQVIPLGQKIANQMVSGVTKVGFHVEAHKD